MNACFIYGCQRLVELYLISLKSVSLSGSWVLVVPVHVLSFRFYLFFFFLSFNHMFVSVEKDFFCYPMMMKSVYPFLFWYFIPTFFFFFICDNQWFRWWYLEKIIGVFFCFYFRFPVLYSPATPLVLLTPSCLKAKKQYAK